MPTDTVTPGGGCGGGGGTPPATTGTVTGTVMGPGGRSRVAAPPAWPVEALIDVLVTCQGTEIDTLTDANGGFTLLNVPPGPQVFEFSKNGLVTKTISADITAGGTVTLTTGGGETVVMETDPETGTKKWTLMVYMAGDNNLSAPESDMATMNLNAMEKAASSDKVNIIAMVDRAAGEKTRFYYIRHDSDEVNVTSPYFELDVNINSGDVSSLNAFVNQVFADYPAEHYMLDLWNHGSGFKSLPGTRGAKGAREKSAPQTNARGICYDDFSVSYMSIMDVRRALESYKEFLGRQLDVVACDACLMQGLEVAYEWSGASLARSKVKSLPADTRLCDYLVASEETIPFEGFPYEACFGPLAAEPDMSALNVAGTMVSAYGAYYDEHGEGYETLSAIDMAQVQGLYDAVDGMAVLMQADTDYAGSLWSNAYYKCIWFGGEGDLIDLDDFAARASVVYGGKGAGKAVHPVMAAADIVRAQVNAAVVSNYYGPGYSADFGSTPGGISIWGYYNGTIPAGHIYEDLEFYPNAWASFIDWINTNNPGEI